MNVYKKIIIVAVVIVLNFGVGFSQTSPYAEPEWGKYTTKDGFLYAHIVDFC